MGSKGRVPPQQLRRPHPGAGIGHNDTFSGLPPPRGAFPPFDMLPPPEVMEQKLAAQHVDMQKLATENQKLAATHGTLRHELAAAQHELQMLHSHMGVLESEREHQARSLMDRIARMEADLQSADSLKLELQKARAEAQELVMARQELVSRVQDLTQDLQKAHVDMQQFPSLMSELENLRQEYQHCRATYDYEKKLSNDHLESLQVMEKNYVTMAREMEKLHADLTNSANLDRRTGIPYGSATGYSENEAAGHFPVGQNAYNDGYRLHQPHGPLQGGNGSGAAGPTGSAPASSIPIATTPVAPAAAAAGTPNAGEKSGVAPTRLSNDAQRVSNYDAHRGAGGPGYDAQRGPTVPGYDAQRGLGGPGYDAQRGPVIPGYELQRGFGGPGYDPQRVPGAHSYDVQRVHGVPGYDSQKGVGGPGYDMQRGLAAAYDPQRGHVYEMQRGASYDQNGPVYDAQVGPGIYEAPKGTEYDQGRGYTRNNMK